MPAVDLVDAVGNVGIIAGAVVAVVTIVAVGYRWAQRIERMLSYVNDEMQHNGGSTIRDAIARMELRQTRMEQHLGITEEEDPTP